MSGDPSVKEPLDPFHIVMNYTGVFDFSTSLFVFLSLLSPFWFFIFLFYRFASKIVRAGRGKMEKWEYKISVKVLT